MSSLNISTVSAYFERRGLDLDYALSYGEPGYSTGKPAILFSNWNNVSDRVRKLLEREFKCEWSDEWYIDHENDAKAYRTSPDGYGWTPSVTFTEDGETITPDDIDRDPEAFIELLVNNPRHCMTPTLYLNLEPHGFSLVETELETGFHPGQNDNPKKVLARLESAMPEHDFIFDTTSVRQFDVRWQVWARPWSDPETNA